MRLQDCLRRRRGQHDKGADDDEESKISARCQAWIGKLWFGFRVEGLGSKI